MDKKFYVLNLHSQKYWKEKGKGITEDIQDAGLFTEREVLNRVNNLNGLKLVSPNSKEAFEKLLIGG